MCGIVGVFNRGTGQPAAADQINRLLGTIRHRGPESAGIMLDGPVGLGHDRLSIIDLPGGQPSGLRIVRDILTDVDDVAFPVLTSADVVRHRLVGHIVDAYARWDAVNAEPAPDHQDRRLGHSSRRGR